MIRAILLDKDGTLTDFRATWEAWMPTMIHALAHESGAEADTVAKAFGFDLATGRIPADGLFVTAPGHVVTAGVASAIGWPTARLSRWLAPRSHVVRQVMVPGVPQVLARLHAAGLPIGILTNADEAEAHRHLIGMGIGHLLHRVIGCDSGFGAKPDPRGAADFADALELPRGSVALVGDGRTDMAAAKGAGLVPVAVLTGTLGHADLSPLAEAVLPDITGLPAWLATRGIGVPAA